MSANLDDSFDPFSHRKAKQQSSGGGGPSRDAFSNDPFGSDPFAPFGGGASTKSASSLSTAFNDKSSMLEQMDR